MDIRSSPIWNEVEEIAKNGPNNSTQSWAVEFLINGTVFKPYQLINIDFDKNPQKNIGVNVIIRVALDASIYMNHVVPNKANMTATLYRYPRSETGGAVDDRPVYTETFKAMVIGGTDALMTPKVNMPGNDAALSTMGFQNVDFQLAPPAIEQLRSFQCGGCYHGKSPGDTLKGIFTRALSGLKLDAEREMTGVQMIPPDNKKVMDNLIIPDGVSLMDLAEFIQYKQGGVYNAGIEFFIMGNTVFIWPRYGLDRHNTNKKVLTVFNLPESALPGAERTFIDSPGHIKIIATGSSSLGDATENIALNEGNGVRFVDAAKLLEGGIKVLGGKMITRRGETINEFVDTVREDGMNIARFAKGMVTSNPYKPASKLSASKGVVMSLEWQNSDPNVLYPGMPVYFFTQRGSELVEKRGILIAEQHLIEPAGKRMKSTHHTCSGGLTFFLSREDYSRVDLLG